MALTTISNLENLPTTLRRLSATLHGWGAGAEGGSALQQLSCMGLQGIIGAVTAIAAAGCCVPSAIWHRVVQLCGW